MDYTIGRFLDKPTAIRTNNFGSKQYDIGLTKEGQLMVPFYMGLQILL